MTQLLIVGTSILAIGPIDDSGTDVITPDIIYPKSLIPGYQIVDVNLPSGFAIQDYEWISGNLHKIDATPDTPTPEQQRAAIQAQIDALEVSTLLNRGSREFEIVSIQDLANRQAVILQPSQPDK